MRIRGICAVAILCLTSAIVSAEVIQIVGGNKQLGCVGQKAQELLSVRTSRKTGGIASNVKVTFSIAQQPSQPLKKGSSGSLSAYEVYTDTNGLASVEFNFGKPNAGDYVITAVTKDTLSDPISFQLIAMQDNWMLMVLFALLGGLGVFLFGMFYLNDSLQKVAGKKFRSLLISLTKNRIKGTMTGLLVTLLNQSSSATTVLEVSLVSAGLLTFYQSIPITIGAEIGSTVTAQLVAFKLSDYAAIIAGFGFFLSFFSKQKRIKSIGDTILGFGILFLGMKLMSDGLMPLKNYKPFLSLMENVGNPFIGIMVGLIFTLVVQSSGATTGIVIALALAGAITLKEAIPINLGASIGTCITAILGSIGAGREGKRVAVFHTLAQTAGVILVYPFLTVVTYKGVPSWIYFAEWFTSAVFNSTELA
ncbi:MAG: Na+/Pi-cotransporter [Elusimicrobia bacterium ADurb.Bin231]|nr:MAG: Na+/Pi-cotransporter [Elusimicrobia bacterium ADurb.Bin231]